MRSELRENQLKVLTQRIAEVLNRRNFETRKALANKWDIHPNEVTSSHEFRKDMLAQYKVVLDVAKGNETYDEVLVTLERGRSLQNTTLISFAIHIFNDDIALHIQHDSDTPETTKEKIASIVYTFIQNELGFK